MTGRASNQSLSQTIPLVKGKTYEVTFTISNYVSGRFRVYLGTAAGSYYESSGTFTETITVAGNTNLNLYAASVFEGDVDNVSIKQVDIPSSGHFDGSELLTDGDMETTDTSAWAELNDSILTKETVDTHGGVRVLRATRNGTTNGALQLNLFTVGKTYRIVGHVRSDGNAIPTVGDNGGTSFTGTTSTSWQAVDVIRTVIYPHLALYCTTSVDGQYCEYDDFSVTEVSPLVGRPTNGVTLNEDAGGHLTKAYSFDGTNDNVNIYSSDLNSVFNPDEGTLVAWAKYTGSWSDDTHHYIVDLTDSGSHNQVSLLKTTSNQLQVYTTAGDTPKSITSSSLGATTDWFQIVATWSKSNDQLKLYLNGDQVESTQTGLGTWSANFQSTGCVIGAGLSTGTSPWTGLINDVRLYDRALSAEEIGNLYSASSDIQAYYSENYSGRELIRKYNDDVVVASLAAEEAGPGPVAWWKFDEGQGQVAQDSTSNGNDGQLGSTSGSDANDPTWKTEDMCVSGKCMEFDGSDDAINITSMTDFASPYSVTFWMKPQQLDTHQNIIGLDDDSFPFIRIQSNNRLLIYAGPEKYRYSSKIFTTADLNKWHHVMIIVDDSSSVSTWKVYIDGNDSSGTTGNNTGNYYSPTGSGFIGGGDTTASGAGTGNFKGFIDEVKIYPYARTAAQVKADYNQYAHVLGVKTQEYLSDGLVGYWKMDETSGTTVADSSGNANTGTLTNAQETGTAEADSSTTTVIADDDNSNLSTINDAYNNMIVRITGGDGCGITTGTERIISDYTYTATPTREITVSTAFSAETDNCTFEIRHQIGGKFGNAVRFDGSNDHVQRQALSNININDNWSTSVWVNPSSTSSTRIVLANSQSANDRWGIEISSGNLRTGIYNGSSYFTNKNTSISANVWTHVATIYDGSEIRLFLNGVEAVATGNVPSLNQDAYFTMGSRTTGSSSYFAGRIDEVRVYNRVLSPSEVKDLYEWAPGPVGYWKMDEKVSGDNQAIHDLSGNGNNGTTSSANGTGMDCTKPGKSGTACEFDGEDDYVLVSDDDLFDFGLSGSFTYSLWAKRNVLNERHELIDHNSSGSHDQWSFIETNGRVYLQMRDAVGNACYTYTSSYIVTDTNWHYITIIRDADTGTIKYYIDGVLYPTTTSGCSGGVNIDMSIQGNIALGSPSDNPNNFMDGLLDEVKIYNYARTQEQIIEDMNAGHPAPGSPIGSPIAHWKFDEQQGQIAHNSSGLVASSLDGTLGATSGSSTDDPTWKTKSDCKVNGCLSFDGGDFVSRTDTSELSITSSLTLSAWVNVSDTSISRPIVTKDAETTNQSFYLLLEGGRVRTLVSSDGSTQAHRTGNTLIPTGSWHHVTGVYNATAQTIDVYVDGQLDNGSLSGTVPSSIYDGNAATRIGHDQRLDRYFIGSIDEVKIYNFALTDDQVKTDYNAGSSMVLGVLGADEAADLADGAGDPPVAEWKLDEKTGTDAFDTSGNGRTGSITGTTWAGGCKQGGCLEFPGILGNYVDVATTQDFNSSFSISAYVFVNSSTSERGDIIAHAKGGHAGWSVYASTNGYLRFIISDSVGPDKSCVIASSSSLNTWHHLGITVDQENDEIRCYLDGKLSNQTTTPAGNDIDQSNNIRIGQRPSLDYYPFNGKVDHIKIYDYARTPAQIAYDYNRGAPVGWWKFDECEGTSAYDASGNGNNGTITPGALDQTSVGDCSTSANTMWYNGRTGKYNSSLNFDGDDDYVIVPDSAKLEFTNKITLSAWLKTSSGSWQSLIHGNNDGLSWANSYWMAVRPEQNTIRCILPGGYSDAAWTYGFSEWMLITCTYDGSDAYVYVNGKQIHTWNGVGTITDESGVTIGRTSNNLYPTNGQIDDVRVYNYALSASQVKKLFNEGASLRFGPVTGSSD